MILSVIIPTRNRAKLLERTLISLLEQAAPKEFFEVIVVDNGSTDGTKETCERLRTSFANFKYIHTVTPGLHVGRHAGLKAASAEILAFIDDDVKVFPCWIQGIMESMADRETVLVGGKALPDFEIAPPEWLDKLWSDHRTSAHLSIVDLGDETMEINPHFIYGCNFAIRKHIVLEAGGFHPDGMPWDLIRFRGDGESHISEYVLTNGYRTIYNPKASVYHFVPRERMTFEYFGLRAFKHGISVSFAQFRKNDRTFASHFAGRFYSLLHRLKFLLKPKKTEQEKLQELLRKSFNEGYNYHQAETKKDPELREWVLKKDYLDYTA